MQVKRPEDAEVLKVIQENSPQGVGLSDILVGLGLNYTDTADGPSKRQVDVGNIVGRAVIRLKNAGKIERTGNKWRTKTGVTKLLFRHGAVEGAPPIPVQRGDLVQWDAPDYAVGDDQRVLHGETGVVFEEDNWDNHGGFPRVRWFGGAVSTITPEAVWIRRTR